MVAQCFELVRTIKSSSGKGLFGNTLPWGPPPRPTSPSSWLSAFRETEGTAQSGFFLEKPLMGPLWKTELFFVFFD